MICRRLFLLLFLFAGLAGAAEGVRPFVAGSLASIVAARGGKPFVLAFWSIGCSHCPAELQALGELKRKHPQLDVVLVAADTPAAAAETARLAGKYGLGKAEQWVFADDVPERLRFDIDRRWHGELPRTHLYGRQQNPEVHIGLVPPAQLLAWVKANVR